MKYIVIVAILFFGVISPMEDILDNDKRIPIVNIGGNQKPKNLNDQSTLEKLNQELLNALEDGYVYSSQGYIPVQDFVYNKKWQEGYFYGESDKEAKEYGDSEQGEEKLKKKKLKKEKLKKEKNEDFITGYSFGYRKDSDLDSYLSSQLDKAQEAKFKQVKTLLEKKANPNYKQVLEGNIINTPLIAAMKTIAYPQVIDLLIHNKADVNIGVINNKHHEAPVIKSAERNLGLIINKHRETPLIQFAELVQRVACRASTATGEFYKLYWDSNYLQQSFEVLLKEGADVNYQGDFGHTFAHRMLEDMTYPRVGIFFAQNVLSNNDLCKKINWSLQDDSGVIIFDYISKINTVCIISEKEESIKELTLNKHVQTIFLQRLFGSARYPRGFEQSNWHERLYNDNCVDFSWQDYKGDTLLHHFMRAIPFSPVGFDPNGKNKSLKQTLALTFWNSDYVAALKKTIKESDLRKVNKAGKTPLNVAVQEKNLFGALYLMFYGAEYKKISNDIQELFKYYANISQTDYAFLTDIDLSNATDKDLKSNLIKNMPQRFFEEQDQSLNYPIVKKKIWDTLTQWQKTPRPVEEVNVNNKEQDVFGAFNNVNKQHSHDHLNQDLLELPKPQGNVFLRFFRHVRNIPSYTIRAFFPAKKEKFQECRTLKGFFVALAMAPFICCKAVVTSCYHTMVEKICKQL